MDLQGPEPTGTEQRGGDDPVEGRLRPFSHRNAAVYYAAGRRAESDEALQDLTAKFSTDAGYQIAEVYAMRAEPDLAFDWLERAYAQRDPGLTHMKSVPRLRSLHSDARWSAFLSKMGLAG